MKKLVLIDGHSILNRAFYGVPNMTNSEGLHTNAVYGFINIMLKILEEEQPDYLTVAFDVHQPTFRHEMFQEYKGTRKPMPAELREQVSLIQEMLQAMGVKIVKQPGLEADDILGTLAKKAEKDGMEVSLISGDRDLLQLATDQIMIRIPKTQRGGTKVENYHTEDVIDKYGVTPSQIVDMKGFMGDSADNIPGVPGVGEKTAVKLLQTFPTVEDAYAHIEEVEPKRVRELLRANKELADLSKKLATIKTDCDLDFSFEEAKNTTLFTKEAFSLVKRLGFKSFIKKFDQVEKEDVLPGQNFVWLKTEKEVKQFLRDLKESKPECVGFSYIGDVWKNEGVAKKKQSKKKAGQISFDLGDAEHFSVAEEEDVEYPFLGVSISYRGAENNVKTVCIYKTDEMPVEKLLPLYEQIQKMTKKMILVDWKNQMHLTTPYRNGHIDEKAGQQAFKDATVQDRKKLLQKIADINIAAYLLNPLKKTYWIDEIAQDYLGLQVPSFEELFAKETLEEIDGKISGLEGNDEDGLVSKLLQYFGNVSYVSCLAWEKMEKQLHEKKMQKLYDEIEMPMVYYLYEMERVGVHADKEELSHMSAVLTEKIANLEQDIYDLAGEVFNINSPKQLGVILFEKMGLPFAKKTKTGYSTSVDVLEKLRCEDPIADKILEYRQYSKFKSTYADGLGFFIGADDRIHGTFNQTITATGRISSTDPNLQNIPVRSQLGREFRKVFKPKDGCVFLDADYSQIELRILAHMSGDEKLIEAYNHGKDIHQSTAATVFHVPFDEVTAEQRRSAKAVNFGIVYGESSFGLAQNLNISRKEAGQYIKQYFEAYPSIKAFLDGLVEHTKTTGEADTLFGRIRPVPEISSSNHMQRGFGERIAMNSPIQGTAADIMKLAMIRVSERLLKEGLQAKVVLQVHDELLVETPILEKDIVKKILEEEMTKVADLKVPLAADVEEGADWYEAH